MRGITSAQAFLHQPSSGKKGRSIGCKSIPREMMNVAISKEARVLELARLVGITIAEEEVAEVANRFESLMLELDQLRDLDLADIQPVTIFPEEE